MGRQLLSLRTYLVDSTGYKGWYICSLIEDLWERAAEGRGSLDRWECNLPHDSTVVETKDALGLVEGHTLPDLTHGMVEGW